MKEEFHKTKLTLIAELKRELDERSIGGAGFFNMKPLVEKLDDIEGGTTRKLPKEYVFPSMGLYSLVVFWFCGDLSKRISPFMLIPRKDCENDMQKCLVSKTKSTMDLVEVVAKRKGMWKSNNYYLGNVSRCKQLFEGVELMFCYPGISHVRHHEECSYLTILELYNKKYTKKFADEIW
eukprot:CAMPEP_0171393228 /NCGR_PEP_ID=MMETSP0880-20121228/2525_1 /TAXON_ID=67004 /ORGANISM="Thalassiosira weissflogii, Strain CCMP1336" /LENGTH=178 /DNA_ID=CAMNT_0011906337 /DNA_START=1670 /DNA_END=2206 /DNA_ORIENTATION=+